MDISPRDRAATETVPSAERPNGFSGRYRRNGRVAMVTVVLLGLVAFFALTSMIHAGMGLRIADAARNKILLPRVFADFDMETASAARFHVGLGAATAVVFLWWLARAVDNVLLLGGGTPSVTPRWSVAWWFIPIANLVKPYQIVRELHDRMAINTSIGGGWIVLAWWLCSILGNAILLASSRLPKSIADPDSLSTFYVTQEEGYGLGFLGAALAIIVVLRIQWRAEDRADSLGIHRFKRPVH